MDHRTITSSLSFFSRALLSARSLLSVRSKWIPILSVLIGLVGFHLEATEIDFPIIDPAASILIRAEEASQTRRGAYRVYELKGKCEIRQGAFLATCNEAVVWLDESQSDDDTKPSKLIVYFDGNVRAAWNSMQHFEGPHWMGRMFSHLPATVRAMKWNNQVGDSSSPTLPWRTKNDSAVVSADFPSDGSDSMVRPAQFPNVPSGATGALPPPLLQGPNSTAHLFDSNRNSGGNRGSFQTPDNQFGGVVFGPDGQRIDQPQVNSAGELIETPAPKTTSSFQPQSPNTINSAPLAANNRLLARSFEIEGRSSKEANIQIMPRPERGDSVATVTRGLRIRIGGIQSTDSSGNPLDVGTVVLEADRAVLWTRDFLALASNGIDQEPLEVYLEGNIVFQQGQRVIYADRMYYNAQSEYGMVLSAEILTPVPQYEGLLRLKADVVEQKSREHFLAYDAALTSSRLGVPRYWLQAGKIELTDSRKETVDPRTGIRTTYATPGATDMEADARNNFLYLGGVPVLYWPILSSNVERPSFYLTGVKFKNDSIFGAQAMLDWDLYQLLGIDGWNGTDWTLSTDYLSKRGFALGTNFTYDLPNGILPGPTAGYADFWGIKDEGQDFIGIDRSGLTPEETTRGRLLFRHRKFLTQNLEFMAEGGWISDRNFLEQYFEREWDQEKDFSTALRLRGYDENRMMDLWGQARINKFYTETEWLPRFDHYWLGQSVLADRFTWYAHSSVGYAHQRIASTPLDPADAAKFALQAGEVDAEGIRATTRQELDLPLNLGPFKFVPYISGEAAHWGEDVTGNDLTRLTGQAGIRTTLPMWNLNSNVESRLLNIRGLAHKVTFKSDLFYADSDKNLDQLPLYDPIDDNSQEHFRRRLVFNTFGGALPPQFESRNFAIRQGMQRFVTATSTEVLEDQMQARFGINQRWQTKRGRVGRERIADLVELDFGMIVFPKADRDNFGEETGGFNYDFRYHLGDRVTLLSDGYMDVFSQGLKMVSIGTMMSRPGRGEWYTGLTSIEGPISSLIASTTINYRLNEKWIATGGTAFDLGEVGNVGQSLSLTRIGESFLVRVGANVDSGRDNVSFQFNIEPRFLPTKRLGAVGGQLIPPAGLYGLE